MEISLESGKSFLWREASLCSREHVENLTSVTLTLQDLLYDVGYGVEKSKNLEAENLGSGPGQAGYQLSYVILAKALSFSEPQNAFL